MSTVQRERAAARARLERQMAEKLEKAQQRKRRNAIVGAAAAVLLVAGGVVWAVLAMQDDKPADTAANGDVSCLWTPEDAAGNPNLKDVGAPPTGKAPNTGTQTMTITMNVGVVEVEVNTAKAPCTARSMTYLASKNFFDNTKCHRLVTEGIKVLQCGDPTGTGMGGPTYKMAEENLPNFTDDLKNYPVCSVAMAKTQEPGSTGSQFFLVWGDTPLPGQYTVLGTMTKGCDVVKKVGADGALPADANGTTAPKNEILIKTVTMTPPQGA